ncbi:hypothetical protein BDK51DRAFT_46611 [Blyttiomyces helicus]|uniref:Uncharacterized protein n=1 Tax=Blyttiomyces helicus TaxID=388810 RepID=A0A4V1IRL0_9FUNG|nr:hypothetical protein BDK51DRAFT_46611 [Blyttiomyces helicus]|eukprot:RKO90427.1 hypothetical protein BDK51DRAFT_46611 [Blyttiomyces helicus]
MKTCTAHSSPKIPPAADILLVPSLTSHPILSILSSNPNPPLLMLPTHPTTLLAFLAALLVLLTPASAARSAVPWRAVGVHADQAAGGTVPLRLYAPGPPPRSHLLVPPRSNTNTAPTSPASRADPTSDATLCSCGNPREWAAPIVGVGLASSISHDPLRMQLSDGPMQIPGATASPGNHPESEHPPAPLGLTGLRMHSGHTVVRSERPKVLKRGFPLAVIQSMSNGAFLSACGGIAGDRGTRRKPTAPGSTSSHLKRRHRMNQQPA